MKLEHSPRGPGRSPEFLKLQIARRVNHPLKDEIPLQAHDKYREQYAYALLITDDSGEKIIDARIVKTRQTLNRIAEEHRVLLHPQPIRIPSGFWEKWKKAGTAEERLRLFKEHELLKDGQIFAITCIVLDVDTDYEKTEPIVLELFDLLGVKGYELGRTKSGNLRAIIYLEPLRVEVGSKEDEEEEGNRKVKAFYLTANRKGKNGHTHLENARELLAIMTAYLRKKGLNADKTFVDRLNHPIWYGREFYTRAKKKFGETKLYDLYRKAKELQRKKKLWSLDGKNLSKVFWNIKPPAEKKAKVIVPSFVAKAQVKALDDLARWRIAVKKLVEKYTSQRFTKVIMPAVGWAMYLNLNRWDVDSYLKELLSDKDHMDEELERAWKYAKPTTFEWSGKTRKSHDLKELTIRFLTEAEEGAPRQFLLSEIFGGQNWLLQIVERFCMREGYVSMEKRKLTSGPGRKSYVYVLTEKGKSFVDALKDNGLGVSYRQVVGFDTSLAKKSNIKLLPYGEEQRVSIETLGLGEDGYNNGCGGICVGREALAHVDESMLSQTEPLSISPNNGRAGDDIVKRKVEGIPEDLVKKHLEDKDLKPKYDPQDPLEKATVKRALELIGRVEQRWNLELGELPNQDGYRRLIFGAVRRRGRIYDLGGWGRFAPALGEVLEDLGHRVIYPRPYELQHELGDYEDEGPSLEELPRNEVDLSDLYDENGEIPF